MKTFFRFDLAVIDDTDVVTLYFDDLLAVCAAVLTINGSTDQQDFQAGKRHNQPSTNRDEIDSNR
ncbi:MAG: hypothetical protein P8163_02905 [Candidatus Thiodiazotropha sp.]